MAMLFMGSVKECLEFAYAAPTHTTTTHSTTSTNATSSKPATTSSKGADKGTTLDCGVGKPVHISAKDTLDSVLARVVDTRKHQAIRDHFAASAQVSKANASTKSSKSNKKSSSRMSKAWAAADAYLAAHPKSKRTRTECQHLALQGKLS